MSIYKTMQCALRHRNQGNSIETITRALAERGYRSRTTGNPLTIAETARLLYFAEARYGNTAASRSMDVASTPDVQPLSSQNRVDHPEFYL